MKVIGAALSIYIPERLCFSHLLLALLLLPVAESLFCHKQVGGSGRAWLPCLLPAGSGHCSPEPELLRSLWLLHLPLNGGCNSLDVLHQLLPLCQGVLPGQLLLLLLLVNSLLYALLHGTHEGRIAEHMIRKPPPAGAWYWHRRRL